MIKKLLGKAGENIKKYQANAPERERQNEERKEKYREKEIKRLKWLKEKTALEKSIRANQPKKSNAPMPSMFDYGGFSYEPKKKKKAKYPEPPKFFM